VNENTPNINDSGFLPQLMPNRTRAKFMHFAAWFCVPIAALWAISALQAISSSAWAHLPRPVVKGNILSYEQKSGVPRTDDLTDLRLSEFDRWPEDHSQLAVKNGIFDCKHRKTC
jgi:hypothetical protein